MFGDKFKATAWLSPLRQNLMGWTAIDFVKDQESLHWVIELLTPIGHEVAADLPRQGPCAAVRVRAATSAAQAVP